MDDLLDDDSQDNDPASPNSPSKSRDTARSAPSISFMKLIAPSSQGDPDSPSKKEEETASGNGFEGGEPGPHKNSGREVRPHKKGSNDQS